MGERFLDARLAHGDRRIPSLRPVSSEVLSRDELEVAPHHYPNDDGRQKRDQQNTTGIALNSHCDLHLLSRLLTGSLRDSERWPIRRCVRCAHASPRISTRSNAHAQCQGRLSPRWTAELLREVAG